MRACRPPRTPVAPDPRRRSRAPPSSTRCWTPWAGTPTSDDHAALFLTYDQNRRVLRPCAAAGAAGRTNERVWDGRPTGLGVRVPMIVISPWTVGGYTYSEVFDHTWLTRFLERSDGRAGAQRKGPRRRRRAVCGDLAGAFDLWRGRRRPSLQRRTRPGIQRPLGAAAAGRAGDAAAGARRPPGPPAALPPDADGGLDAGASVFRMAVRDGGRASAHLALYPYAKEYDVPQHREVARAPAQWDVPVKDGAYRFTVTGPNGFRREFAGAGRRRRHGRQDRQLDRRAAAGDPSDGRERRHHRPHPHARTARVLGRRAPQGEGEGRAAPAPSRIRRRPRTAGTTWRSRPPRTRASAAADGPCGEREGIGHRLTAEPSSPWPLCGEVHKWAKGSFRAVTLLTEVGRRPSVRRAFRPAGLRYRACRLRVHSRSAPPAPGELSTHDPGSGRGLSPLWLGGVSGAAQW